MAGRIRAGLRKAWRRIWPVARRSRHIRGLREQIGKLKRQRTGLEAEYQQKAGALARWGFVGKTRAGDPQIQKLQEERKRLEQQTGQKVAGYGSRLRHCRKSWMPCWEKKIPGNGLNAATKKNLEGFSPALGSRAGFEKN